MNRELVVGTFEYFLWLNDRIYGKANKIVHPSRSELLTKAICYAARLREKGIHAKDNDIIIHSSVMVYSWMMAFANRMGIEKIHEHLFRRFLFCPYCKSRPCICRSGISKPVRSMFTLGSSASPSVYGFQLHLTAVYPKNNLDRSGLHLVAEIAELMEAWMTYRRQSVKEQWEHVLEEFCDVIAHLVAVAHCAKFNLSEEMVKVFQNGCPTCSLWECTCGYTETVGSRLVEQPVKKLSGW